MYVPLNMSSAGGPHLTMIELVVGATAEWVTGEANMAAVKASPLTIPPDIYDLPIRGTLPQQEKGWARASSGRNFSEGKRTSALTHSGYKFSYGIFLAEIKTVRLENKKGGI
jgi:hypothetical protein